MEAGYGEYLHGIGHGIWTFDIHEEPYFSQTSTEVKSGMVLTDEPGIYIEGKYVRIEDDILITKIQVVSY